MLLRRLMAGPLTRYTTFNTWTILRTRPPHISKTPLHTPLRVRNYSPYNYQRFSTSKQLLLRWAQSPTFYYQVAGFGTSCGAFYIYKLETVPISLRKRFNVISSAYERSMGEKMYREILRDNEGKLLPPSHPQVRMVKRVLDRLIPHADLPSEDQKWEIHVIQDSQANAFVIPGGKVFVYSGLFRLARDDDGLAAVLGHEIAHNVAHHAAEKMSRSMIVLPVAVAVAFALGVMDTGLTNMAVEYGFMRPNGRAQESEADHIGLLMMAKACFDPDAAVAFWHRMQQDEAQRGAPPQFLSTHPSAHDRMGKIQKWLADAQDASAKSGCAQTQRSAQQFRRAFDTLQA